MRRDQLVAEFLSTPWALLPQWASMLSRALASDAGAEELHAELDARYGGGPKAREAGAIAVIPMYGVLTQRADFFNELFGGGSVPTGALAALVRQAANDDNIAGIVLDVDSPGGSVGGLTELSDAIYGARSAKPIVAVSNSMMASAAYWTGSAAAEVVVAPEGSAGSIGVWTAHVDASKALEGMGLSVSLISAGKYKVEGNPYGPLSQEARDHLQAQVNDYYEMFVKAVARNRGDTQTAVRSGYGEGRMLTAKEAVKAKIADRVAPLSEVIGALQAKTARAGSRQASAAELRERDL